MVNFVVIPEENSFENIFKDKTAQITNVGVVVDGMPNISMRNVVWPAGI
jgi:hypothetical protein